MLLAGTIRPRTFKYNLRSVVSRRLLTTVDQSKGRFVSVMSLQLMKQREAKRLAKMSTQFGSPIKQEQTQSYAATYIGKVKTNAKVVIAIDFGTTNSGVSFVLSDNPEKVNCGAPGARFSRDEVKVPTVLLKGPGGWCFGREAICKYNELLDTCRDEITERGSAESAADVLRASGISFFRHFKMQLKNKTSGFDRLTATSTTGEKHKLMDLIAISLNFLSQFAMSEIKSGWASALNIQKEDILWVLTVPAIWNDFGKAFMRKAAHQAGMIDDEASEKLLLALEPESASIAVHGEGASLGLFKESSSFLMLDCGGGTVDITLHRVATEEPLVLSEIATPQGGPWGGIFVDLHFKYFLKLLFGIGRFEVMEAKYPVEIAEVMEEFRFKKEDFNPTDRRDTYISLASLLSEDITNEIGIPSLISLLAAYNLEQPTFAFDLSSRRVKKKIEQLSTLTFSSDHFLNFFQPTLDNICETVKALVMEHLEIDAVVVVGGYGSSKALGQRLRSEFETAPFHKKIVIPDNALRPQAAIVHGAAYFGLYTCVIGTRIARCTYGVECSILWFPGCGFPESDAKLDAKLKGKWVRNKFSSIVSKGTSLSPTEIFRSGKHTPMYDDQTSVRFTIFQSNDYRPERTISCHKLGEIVVPCRDQHDIFHVEFMFGADLRVEIVRKDGERNSTIIQMEN